MRNSIHGNLLFKTVPLIGICALLSSCAGADKSAYTSSTSQGYGETRKVEVKETADSRITTETMTSVEPKYNRRDELRYKEETASFQAQPYVEPAPGELHREPVETSTVRAPGLRVRSNDRTGELHVNAPFVKVNKDGHGKRVNIKVPFVNISANDD